MSKTLVAYYSAQNHTKTIAQKIAQELGADLFEIAPKVPYTADDLDWMSSTSRVVKEHDQEGFEVELSNVTPDKWSEYDTIIIGYPIWWGIAAWPVNTFVKHNDFTNKTVIPFCTSHSSDLGDSDQLLKELSSTGNWKPGFRFYQDAEDKDITNWVKNLK